MILFATFSLLTVILLLVGIDQTRDNNSLPIFGGSLVCVVIAILGFFIMHNSNKREHNQLLSVTKQQDAQIKKLQAVIGPGFKSDDGQYSPNDIIYVNADTTGVEFNLESSPFYWKGSYTEAFQIMERLCLPDSTPFYNYLLYDIMSKELIKKIRE